MAAHLYSAWSSNNYLDILYVIQFRNIIYMIQYEYTFTEWWHGYNITEDWRKNILLTTQFI